MRLGDRRLDQLASAEMAGPEPERGEVYEVDLDPVDGHEQAGRRRRPLLVISIDAMNRSAAGLVIGAPLTTTDWHNAMHVRLEPPEGGLTKVSFAMPEMIRSISTRRLRRRLGSAPADTVDAVAKRAGILIGLGRSR
jgi:mRNA interferase MazF